MIMNLHEKQMHRKLSYITKGTHSGLDCIKAPTAEWYYSPKSDELYPYLSGVFESHAANTETQTHFHEYHTLKVIPGIAFEVNVIRDSMGHKIEPMVPSFDQLNEEE